MSLIRDFIRLIFPLSCCVCGEPLVEGEPGICARCLMRLPLAMVPSSPDNYVSRRVAGRVPAMHATSLLLFQHGNATQTILHQIKYRNNQPLALTMGRQMGLLLSADSQFGDIDMLVPVPLHRRKQKIRGYNQSMLLCKGIAQTFPRDISDGDIVRTRYTQTQTRKTRLQRVDNMSGVFSVANPEAFRNKHILLVDDVITTGATLDACWQAFKGITGVSVSIASLAIAGDN